MGKNNRLIEQMKTIARRNRANNVQIARMGSHEGGLPITKVMGFC